MPGKQSHQKAITLWSMFCMWYYHHPNKMSNKVKLGDATSTDLEDMAQTHIFVQTALTQDNFQALCLWKFDIIKLSLFIPNYQTNWSEQQCRSRLGSGAVPLTITTLMLWKSTNFTVSMVQSSAVLVNNKTLLYLVKIRFLTLEALVINSNLHL